MKLHLFKLSLLYSIIALCFSSLIWILFPKGFYLDFILFPFIWCIIVSLSALFFDLLLNISFFKYNLKEKNIYVRERDKFKND